MKWHGSFQRRDFPRLEITEPSVGGQGKRARPLTAARRVLGLIVDNLQISKWQAQALLRISDTAEFVIFNCTNTRHRRRLLKHALYYALNLLSLKSPLTRRRPLPEGLQVRRVISFEAETDGAWQRLPSSVLEKISDHQPQAIIKFGMGLLRVPAELRSPILSYHHGDPRRFRGRPAGFYELLTDQAVVGQMVQILSDRLDAGHSVAFAETRVVPHSYRATMIEAYSCSALLLPRAIECCLSGETLPLETRGRNYRLPSNRTVWRFALRLIAAKVRRIFYGLFFEKQWEVAQADASSNSIEALASQFPQPSSWSLIERPTAYQFLADPFPHPNGGVLVEALRKRDQLGEIVHFSQGVYKVVCDGPGHLSYPSVCAIRNEIFLLPEMSSWSTPKLFRLDGDDFLPFQDLEIDGRLRLKDPTLLQTADGVFLFANDASEGTGLLRLWNASAITDQFSEHPASPIRISPVGSRMGGAIARTKDRLIRFGQDCAHDYGAGIVAFEIQRMTRTEYSEKEIGYFTLEGAKGPHTLNFDQGRVIFDFYRDCFTPLAGLRRLRAHRSRRISSRLPKL